MSFRVLFRELLAEVLETSAHILDELSRWVDPHAEV